MVELIQLLAVEIIAFADLVHAVVAALSQGPWVDCVFHALLIVFNLGVQSRTYVLSVWMEVNSICHRFHCYRTFY